MRKYIRLLSFMTIVLFALLCSQQPIMAEQNRDGYVDDMFKKDLDNKSEDVDLNDTTNKEPTVPPLVDENQKVGVTAGDFVKMFFALIFVIGLLYATLKFINNKSRSYKSSQLIENIGGTSLGGNRSVQLVKVGDRLLIVGVGESINLLTEISDRDEFEAIITEYNDKLEQFSQPNDLITKVVSKINKKQQPEERNGEFGQMLQNEFKEIREGRKSLYDEIEKKGTDG